MTIASSLDSMWLMLWGKPVLASLAILAAFAYLCYRKKYGIIETLYVIFPVIMGMAITPAVSDKSLPAWVGGIIIMGIGALWGFALAKAFSSFTEPYTKVYMVILCMNLALTMTTYPMATYNYLNNGQTANISADANKYPSGLTAQDFILSVSGGYTIASIVIDALLGGAVINMLYVSGIPHPYVDMIALPYGVVGLLSLFPLLTRIWEFLRPMLEVGVGVFGKAVSALFAIFH